MNKDMVKRFIALLLCFALAVMPTVDVSAKTITLHGADVNNIVALEREILYPYDTFSWDTTGINTTNAELLVKYVYNGDPDGEFDSGQLKVSDYKTNPYDYQITKSHEDLDHWRISSDLGGDNTTTKVFLTLEAIYKIYTIKFDPQGGKCDRKSMTTARNGKLTDLPMPTWDSRHVFRGWFDAPEGGTKIDTNYVFNRDTTVYAQWKVGKTTPTPTPRPTATPTPSHEEGQAAVENERTGSEEYNPSAIGGFCYVDGMPQTNTKIGRQEQSPLAEMVFAAAIPPGWNSAFSMSMTVNGQNDYSLKTGELLLYVPGAYQKPGRQFALLAMDKNGKVLVLNDIDNQPNSMTVKLNIEGYAFHLIYKD